MKAFLLAAGTGSRLQPLTDTTPKCLIPIAGKPLLGWWMELFRLHGVTDVLINTHHLRPQVRDYIETHNNQCNQPTLYEAYEEKLLGSGGTVLKNRYFVKGEDMFLICYADNLTDIKLTELIGFHRAHNEVLTMALATTNAPEQSGIAALDHDGLVIEFEEKPTNPKSNLANAGIYITDSRILDHFPNQSFIDIAKDVLPKFVGHMRGYKFSGYHLDIGTPDNLNKARNEWPQVVNLTK